MPQPKTRVGMRMRGGTLTMRKLEKGCHANCAMEEIDATRENCVPVRPTSSLRWKSAAVPKTALSNICKKYIQKRSVKICLSVFRKILLFCMRGQHMDFARMLQDH